jgi:hypothetical protein
MRRPKSDDERDESPTVLVPALNDYVKTSRLAVFAHIRWLKVLRCNDRVFRADSLLGIPDLSETDLREGRRLVWLHNLASTEHRAARETCLRCRRSTRCMVRSLPRRSEANRLATESEVSLPLHGCLRQ